MYIGTISGALFDLELLKTLVEVTSVEVDNGGAIPCFDAHAKVTNTQMVKLDEYWGTFYWTLSKEVRDETHAQCSVSTDQVL